MKVGFGFLYSILLVVGLIVVQQPLETFARLSATKGGPPSHHDHHGDHKEDESGERKTTKVNGSKNMPTNYLYKSRRDTHSSSLLSGSSSSSSKSTETEHAAGYMGATITVDAVVDDQTNWNNRIVPDALKKSYNKFHAKKNPEGIFEILNAFVVKEIAQKSTLTAAGDDEKYYKIYFFLFFHWRCQHCSKDTEFIPTVFMNLQAPSDLLANTTNATTQDKQYFDKNDLKSQQSSDHESMESDFCEMLQKSTAVAVHKATDCKIAFTYTDTIMPNLLETPASVQDIDNVLESGKREDKQIESFSVNATNYFHWKHHKSHETDKDKDSKVEYGTLELEVHLTHVRVDTSRGQDIHRNDNEDNTDQAEVSVLASGLINAFNEIYLYSRWRWTGFTLLHDIVMPEDHGPNDDSYIFAYKVYFARVNWTCTDCADDAFLVENHNDKTDKTDNTTNSSTNHYRNLTNVLASRHNAMEGRLYFNLIHSGLLMFDNIMDCNVVYSSGGINAIISLKNTTYESALANKTVDMKENKNDPVGVLWAAIQ